MSVGRWRRGAGLRKPEPGTGINVRDRAIQHRAASKRDTSGDSPRDERAVILDAPNYAASACAARLENDEHTGRSGA